MMRYSKPVTELIRQRFSCRTYDGQPINPADRGRLESFLATLETGPFGAQTRFKLVAAQEGDATALKGLGTYGMIRRATGYILGAVAGGERNLEDFGYQMEASILYATDLGLGTCWLGGTFTRSSFAERMGLQTGELMPAVTSVGYPADGLSLRDRLIRLGAGSEARLSWDQLFFDGDLGVPLSHEDAEDYAPALEAVRLGPSASNKQPWRVVRDDGAWNFYLRRTPGYLRSNGGRRDNGDLQRADIGIALCHWELTALELGLQGHWSVDRQDRRKTADLTEYTASWIED